MLVFAALTYVHTSIDVINFCLLHPEWKGFASISFLDCGATNGMDRWFLNTDEKTVVLSKEWSLSYKVRNR